MNTRFFLGWSSLMILAAGCTMAPKYTRPAAPVPAQWPTGPAYAENAANSPDAAQLAWREFIADPKLQQLVGLALTNNRDLRLAALNVERARAIYGIQRDALFPSVNANAGGSKASVPGDLSSSGRRNTIERYDVNLGVAGWEIDFFGRIRSLKDRALAEYLGTAQARNAAQTLVIAGVAQTYFALAADRENLKLAETTLAAQQETLGLIQRRQQRGIAPELDVQRVQAQVEAARADVAVFTRLIAEDENALNLLLGTKAPVEWLPAALDSVTPPADVSAGLPSEVLLRRPDVLQAEHSLRAANADIGAARAAFFPRITLSTAIGTASSDLSGLFKAGSGAWSYAPQIVMPIFDARTWSAHKAAKVQREMAVAQYERAIQTAFRDVADALAARGTLDQQAAAQAALVKAVAETHRLSQLRYDKGMDSYLSVLDAQRTLYGAQQGMVALRLANLASRVRLYQVLGGGWAMDGAKQP